MIGAVKAIFKFVLFCYLTCFGTVLFYWQTMKTIIKQQKHSNSQA